MDSLLALLHTASGSLPDIMTILGVISTASFALVAIGDFIVATVDRFTAATKTKKDDEFAKGLSKWWIVTKDTWENFRSVFDKVSIFSRPKK